MGGLFDALFGALDRRLFSTVLIPILFFLSALGALIAAGVGWTETLRWWTGLNAELRVLLALLALVLVLLSAQLFAARLPALIKRYQGEWRDLPGGEWLAGRLTRRHRVFFQWLTEEDDRWASYPVSERQLMPTTFGNILRGAAEHSADRYRLDSSTAWPRLYPVLPEAFRQAFALATADLEHAITISALGGAFAVVGGLLGAFLLPWYGAFLCLSGGLLVAWGGYRAAIRAAEPYGQLYRAAFDVHRWLLLDAMGLDRPADFDAELKQWTALDQMWMRGSVSTDRAAHLGYPKGLPPAPEGGESEPTPLPPSASEPPPEIERPPSVATRPIPPSRVRRSRTRPVLVALLAVVFLGCAVLSVTAVGRSSGSGAAARDLPAYHVLAAGDVTGAAADRLLGRYTLRPIAAKSPIAPGELGPPLPSGRLTRRSALALGPPQVTVIPALGRGGIITIHVVPKNREKASVTASGAVVLDVLGERGVVLAVTRDQLAALTAALPDGTVHLVLELP
ncbi:hypothetical protein SAMN05444920_102228 [Nonomuraea solani]|uniref:Uncharacterized protein n=1 Tax=Nonomuraea solani TaxID=1144553 RepID=A0A1H5YC11_9ACTN|nr:hypothetical protein [Nonomuraea solani]SEG21649.1 hypothetical protein SAMN05444920_102228 [Nonomuraea solani]